MVLLTGDVIHDNTVDIDNLIILRNVYNSISGADRYNAGADPSTDGQINLADLVYLGRNYSKVGYSCTEE